MSKKYATKRLANKSTITKISPTTPTAQNTSLVISSTPQRSNLLTNNSNNCSTPAIYNIHVHISPLPGGGSVDKTQAIQPIIHFHFDDKNKNIKLNENWLQESFISNISVDNNYQTDLIECDEKNTISYSSRSKTGKKRPNTETDNNFSSDLINCNDVNVKKKRAYTRRKTKDNSNVDDNIIDLSPNSTDFGKTLDDSIIKVIQNESNKPNEESNNHFNVKKNIDSSPSSYEKNYNLKKAIIVLTDICKEKKYRHILKKCGVKSKNGRVNSSYSINDRVESNHKGKKKNSQPIKKAKCYSKKPVTKKTFLEKLGLEESENDVIDDKKVNLKQKKILNYINSSNKATKASKSNYSYKKKQCFKSSSTSPSDDITKGNSSKKLEKQKKKLNESSLELESIPKKDEVKTIKTIESLPNSKNSLKHEINILPENTILEDNTQSIPNEVNIVLEKDKLEDSAREGLSKTVKNKIVKKKNKKPELLNLSKRSSGIYSFIYSSDEEEIVNDSNLKKTCTSLVEGYSFSEIVNKFQIKGQNDSEKNCLSELSSSEKCGETIINENDSNINLEKGGKSELNNSNMCNGISPKKYKSTKEKNGITKIKCPNTSAHSGRSPSSKQHNLSINKSIQHNTSDQLYDSEGSEKLIIDEDYCSPDSETEELNKLKEDEKGNENYSLSKDVNATKNNLKSCSTNEFSGKHSTELVPDLVPDIVTHNHIDKCKLLIDNEIDSHEKSKIQCILSKNSEQQSDLPNTLDTDIIDVNKDNTENNLLRESKDLNGNKENESVTELETNSLCEEKNSGSICNEHLVQVSDTGINNSEISNNQKTISCDIDNCSKKFEEKGTEEIEISEKTGSEDSNKNSIYCIVENFSDSNNCSHRNENEDLDEEKEKDSSTNQDNLKNKDNTTSNFKTKRKKSRTNLNESKKYSLVKKFKKLDKKSNLEIFEENGIVSSESDSEKNNTISPGSDNKENNTVIEGSVSEESSKNDNELKFLNEEIKIKIKKIMNKSGSICYDVNNFKTNDSPLNVECLSSRSSSESDLKISKKNLKRKSRSYSDDELSSSSSSISGNFLKFTDKNKSTPRKESTREPKNTNENLDKITNCTQNMTETSDFNKSPLKRSKVKKKESVINIQELQQCCIEKEMSKRSSLFSQKKSKPNKKKLKTRKQSELAGSESSLPPKKKIKISNTSKSQTTSNSKKKFPLDEDYISLNVSGPTKFAVAPLDKVKPYQNHDAMTFKEKKLFGDRIKRFSDAKDFQIYKRKQAARKSG